MSVSLTEVADQVESVLELGLDERQVGTPQAGIASRGAHRVGIAHRGDAIDGEQ